MPMPITGIFLTAAISQNALKNYLTSALKPNDPATTINERPLTPYIVTDTNWDAIQLPIPDPFTTAPFTSPFLGKEASEISDLLFNKTQESELDHHGFIILDEQTSRDGSALVAHRFSKEKPIEIVRTTAEESLSILTAIGLGCLGIDEVQCLVGEDGVYKPEPNPNRVLGGEAPRKQL